ncbi:hypothetical protein OUZ56_009026 [Daphnia magna]|uniref:Uncharacterized protein n=1 Tax=Daphnia magna TaxID=35525 RepID=A0ABR0AES0_9CRUS|nr:hypothetical protein OUZ56_009026 [Daphnia magna]
MEKPVEGERNDVRIELIEAEPAEFIPPEYSLSSRRGRRAMLIHSLFSPNCPCQVKSFPVTRSISEKVRSPPAAASSSLPAAYFDVPARDRAAIRRLLSTA